MMTMNTIRRFTLSRVIAAARHRHLASRSLAALTLLATLAAPATLTAQSTNGGLVIADFNHDGIPDTLVPSGKTTFTLSYGAVPYGTFNPVARLVSAPAGCSAIIPAGVVAGDFNGDGFADLAITCTGANTPTVYTIYVLINNGDGTFTNTASFPGLSGLVAADFNHDNILDLAAAGATGVTSGQAIYMIPGKGDGTFSAATVTPLQGASYTSPVAIDVDQDGYPDLALANFSSQGANSVDIFANKHNGTFGTSINGVTLLDTSIPVGNYPAVVDQTIMVGNFFGGSSPDVAVVDTGTAAGIYLAQNTSSGGVFSFATPTKVLVSGLSSAVSASFVGATSDLLAFNGSTLSVLANDGTGNFTPSYAGLATSAPSSIYGAVDANGDGHADIYTATTGANGVSLTVNLVSGSATAVSQSFQLPAGTTPVAAAWPGNINFNATTASGSQIVNAIASSVGLTSSKNPSLVGDSVTFTGSVLPATSGNYIPTGTLTFSDGGITLGTITLGSQLTGSVTTSALTAGSHPIQVIYSGDTIFAGSTFTLTQVVNKIVPAITWPTPGAITYGTPLSATQLNATATNPVGGATVPGTLTYTPNLGTVLNAGQQTLNVLFTPTDLATYTTATGSVTLVVNAAAPTLTWVPAVSTITYGTALGAQQLNAAATGIGGASVPGTFVYTPASGAVLGVGPQRLAVVFTPTSSNYAAAQSAALVTVTQATPTLTWPTPASIAYGIPLSASQLNATATGVTGAALPGTFVYTPAAGAVLNPGTQTLSVTYTPTDATDYTTATTTVQLVISDLTLTSFTPNTGTIGDPAKTITITGSGFVATTVARVNGTSIATTLVNPTTLTAIIPATYFAATGTLQITLSNPTTQATTAAQTLIVSAPTAGATITGPSTSAPGTQPALNFALTAPYPLPIVATFTLTDRSGVSSGFIDPAVQFAAGGTTYTVTIPAGTTVVPPIGVQAGTIAATITVPVTLTANGVNVTPVSLTPLVIVVPPAVPAITVATLAKSGKQLTVTITGFSNTLDIVKADFHFTPISGASLGTTDLSADVATVFATYFNANASLYGSTFIYTQVFNVSDDAANIASVQVKLTNSVGASTVQTAQ